MTSAMTSAPKRKHHDPQREKPYQMLLSWASLNWPSVWRLRIDILIVLSVTQITLALLSPALFVWLRDDYEDCGMFCYNPGHINLAVFFYALIAFILACAWAYFVSRGTRLRGVVPRAASPGLFTLLIALLPLLVSPLIAGHSMFASAYGGDLGTLFIGRTADYVFPGYSWLDTIGWFSLYSVMFFGIGLIFASYIAIGLKIVILDGLMGLVRATVIAAILTIISFSVLLLIQNTTGGYELSTVYWFLVIAVFSAPVLLTCLVNRRWAKLRAAAIAYTMYLPAWLLVTLALWDEFNGYSTEFWHVAVMYLSGVFLILFIFRRISRINLLPQP